MNFHVKWRDFDGPPFAARVSVTDAADASMRRKAPGFIAEMGTDRTQRPFEAHTSTASEEDIDLPAGKLKSRF